MLPIVYCGDTDLTGAASYLAGLLTAWGFEYEYVPSGERLRTEHVRDKKSLFIFSDYPAAQVLPELAAAVAEQIQDGAGLLMIGGWESFHGLGGDWDRSPISELLPVEIETGDDRMNFAQPTLLVRKDDHPAIAGLPWDDEPPTIGGMNRVKAKAGTIVALNAQSFRATAHGGRFEFHSRAEFPALVLGTAGKGRTAAFLPDVAPHWVGGFVDWGDTRVTAQADGAPAIEVGNLYSQFWKQLIQWTVRVD